MIPLVKFADDVEIIERASLFDDAVGVFTVRLECTLEEGRVMMGFFVEGVVDSPPSPWPAPHAHPRHAYSGR